MLLVVEESVHGRQQQCQACCASRQVVEQNLKLMADHQRLTDDLVVHRSPLVLHILRCTPMEVPMYCSGKRFVVQLLLLVLSVCLFCHRINLCMTACGSGSLSLPMCNKPQAGKTSNTAL